MITYSKHLRRDLLMYNILETQKTAMLISNVNEQYTI